MRMRLQEYHDVARLQFISLSAKSDGLAHDDCVFTTLGLVLALPGHRLAFCLPPYHSNLARKLAPVQGRLVSQFACAP